MSHDDGATIRLVAALVRAYDDGEGHMVVSLHPETLREMALAAKREVERLRAERDARPDGITPDDAARIEIEIANGHVGSFLRVQAALRAHAAKAVKP